MSNIRNHRNHGVYLEFDNGNNISTVWGIGTYSTNYYYPSEGRMDFEAIPENKEADQVEILFNCGDKLHKRLHNKFDGDDHVIGRVSIKDWLYIVNAIANEKR